MIEDGEVGLGEVADGVACGIAHDGGNEQGVGTDLNGWGGWACGWRLLRKCGR